MKNLYHILLSLFCLLVMPATLRAQKITADSLVSQGIKLHDQGKYKEAVEKYNDALKLEPDNNNAKYEMAYTYSVSGNRKQTITILEKLLKNTKGQQGQAYDLLGSSYDDEGQSQKAIEVYLAGIKNQPDYQRLYYNIGLTYYRLNKYAEAEQYAIEAIKLEPEHASAHKLYGELAYYQGRKVCAVMAFCNFLLIEPKTDRSKVVMENIDKVFKGVDKKNINIIYDKTNGGLLNTLITEMALTRAASAVDSLQQKGVTDSAAIFTYQLETIFKAAGAQSAEIKAPKGFYWNYYADFFYALAQSGNLPAFARYISLSSNHQTSVEWFKNNDDKITKLSQWLATTKRNF